MSDTRQSKLEGWVPPLADEAELLAALEKAFDYRGDVTITRRDGTAVTGYLFDRSRGAGLDDSYVRLMPADGSGNMRIEYRQIARLQFSDRDPAAGKSWENWVRKYVAKKMSGESASIYSEPLE